ncbi:hypothetical protein V2J09_020696 [Rumex salicifolius]
MELETTKVAAQEELNRRDNQISILNQLLNRAIMERDDALQKSHKLHLENHLLHRCNQPPPITGGDPVSGISSVEEEKAPVLETEHLSPECEENNTSPAVAEESVAVTLVPRKPLPEKGNLLQAVMKAGPLLQTLLLAGPLPQWRNQPPVLEPFEIPPVGIGCCESGGSSGSGVAGDGSSPTRPYKFQRIAS